MNVKQTMETVNTFVKMKLAHFTVNAVLDIIWKLMDLDALVYVVLVLHSNFNFNADIDECAINTDGCDQICTNTNGSFYCSCNTGYRLNVDNKTCDG